MKNKELLEIIESNLIELAKLHGEFLQYYNYIERVDTSKAISLSDKVVAVARDELKSELYRELCHIQKQFEYKSEDFLRYKKRITEEELVEKCKKAKERGFNKKIDFENPYKEDSFKGELRLDLTERASAIKNKVEEKLSAINDNCIKLQFKEENK